MMNTAAPFSQITKALSRNKSAVLRLCNEIGLLIRRATPRSWKTLAKRSVAWYSVRVNALPITQLDAKVNYQPISSADEANWCDTVTHANSLIRCIRSKKSVDSTYHTL